MRLFANANYDFLGRRRIAYAVTAVFLLAGLVAMFVRGVNYSVEFTGGTRMRIEAVEPVDVGAIRDGLATQGITGAEIQTFGSDREFVIRAGAARQGADPDDTGATTSAIRNALDAVIGAGQYRVLDSGAVSPRSAESSGPRRSSRFSSRSSRCWPTWPCGSSGASAWPRSSPPHTTSSP